MPRGLNCGCNENGFVNNCSCCNPSPTNVACRSDCPFSAHVLVCNKNNRPACGYKVILTNPCLNISLSAVTNCTGRIIFSCLPAGRYICTLVGKNNLTNSTKSSSIRFELDCFNPCQNVCLTTASVECSGRITVKLISNNPNKPLKCGEFKLKTAEGEFIGVRKTNAQGIATFTNLPQGDYVLKQIKAPGGYKKHCGEINVSLTKDKKCANITVTNCKKHCGCICLCLKECRTKKPICGAKFAIYDDCHKKIGCETTNKKGCLMFKHLKVPEKYYIKQLTTKPGFSKIKTPICVHLKCDYECKEIKICNRKKPCPDSETKE